MGQFAQNGVMSSSGCLMRRVPKKCFSKFINNEYFNNVSVTNNKIYYSSNISHFPEEFQLHNYCRILPLDIYERSGTYYAPQHAFVDFDWRNGPWCFVLNPEKVAKI